jgi:hypothetical protein
MVTFVAPQYDLESLVNSFVITIISQRVRFLTISPVSGDSVFLTFFHKSDEGAKNPH